MKIYAPKIVAAICGCVIWSVLLETVIEKGLLRQVFGTNTERVTQLRIFVLIYILVL